MVLLFRILVFCSVSWFRIFLKKVAVPVVPDYESFSRRECTLFERIATWCWPRISKRPTKRWSRRMGRNSISTNRRSGSLILIDLIKKLWFLFCIVFAAIFVACLLLRWDLWHWGGGGGFKNCLLEGPQNHVSPICLNPAVFLPVSIDKSRGDGENWIFTFFVWKSFSQASFSIKIETFLFSLSLIDSVF